MGVLSAPASILKVTRPFASLVYFSEAGKTWSGPSKHDKLHYYYTSHNSILSNSKHLST